MYADVHNICLTYTPAHAWCVSQVTCGDHVKWITDEKSRKDRSVSEGETMSIEKDSDLKRRVRIGDSRHRCVLKSNRGLKDLSQGAGETRCE